MGFLHIGPWRCRRSPEDQGCDPIFFPASFLKTHGCFQPGKAVFVPWPTTVGSGWSGQPSLWWYSRSKVKLGSQPVGQSGYAAWPSSWVRKPQEHWAGSPWQGSARVSPSLAPWVRALSQIMGCVARHRQGCEGSEQSGLAASGSHGWGPALAEASPQPCPGASPQGHRRERQPSAEPPSRRGAVGQERAPLNAPTELAVKQVVLFDSLFRPHKKTVKTVISEIHSSTTKTNEQTKTFESNYKFFAFEEESIPLRMLVSFMVPFVMVSFIPWIISKESIRHHSFLQERCRCWSCVLGHWGHSKNSWWSLYKMKSLISYSELCSWTVISITLISAK